MGDGRKREWVRRKVDMVAGGPRWTLRVRALSAALRRRRNGPAGVLPHVGLLRLLYENVVFHLLWVLESIIVLAKLCFFFLRFGFRL